MTTSNKRLWNKAILLDLFPLLPPPTLETLLDISLAKNLHYNLSQPKHYSAVRLTSLVVAHCRHAHSDYDALLRQGLERFEARKRTAQEVWRVLRRWCPWESANPVLERCWRATVLRPEEREPGWDPMDLDGSESERECGGGDEGDPMDLD
jgi:hypothetical protein